MEKWKIEFNTLIKDKENKEYLKRGEEISTILDKLSYYKNDPNKTYLNIQSGFDFSREELRGACQRYIYGQFQDSIIYSCFSFEMGLIAKLDELLTECEKNTFMSDRTPPTLSSLINKAIDNKILNEETKKIAFDLSKIRNIHIHIVNFISPVLISYQKITENSGLNSLGKEIIEEKLKKAYDLAPGLESILKNYYKTDEINADDIMKVYKSVEALPNFKWAANQEYLKSIENEVNDLMSTMVKEVISGNILELQNYFNNYILRKKALESLKYSEQLLSEFKII